MLTNEQARHEISQFASALAWQESGKIDITSWTGGNMPRSMGIFRNNMITEYLETEYLQIPTNEKAKAALAFFREGISLDNPFYAFLSFYKAFSVAIPKTERGAWITNNLDFIKNPRAKERLEELKKTEKDIGVYLFKRGRHAIAHADQEPFVNPDSTDDHYRLSLDLPLMRNFAELAMEEKLELLKKQTIYRKHLYELEGFRSLLTNEEISKFTQGQGNELHITINLPEYFTILAKKEHQQFAFEKMFIVSSTCVDFGLEIIFESESRTVRLRINADFSKEELNFDPILDLQIKPHRTQIKSIEEEIIANEFQHCILSNGHLEIWDPFKKSRFACSSGYLPRNCMVNDEYFKNQIRSLELLKSELNSKVRFILF
jgi:hypothetical protein